MHFWPYPIDKLFKPLLAQFTLNSCYLLKLRYPFTEMHAYRITVLIFSVANKPSKFKSFSKFRQNI